MRLAIIGAGISGLACAEALAPHGHEVALFDKGRRPGGRMSVRRVETPLGPASFDHGAQYFSARDPAFRARVERWAEAGVAARWPAAGEDAWVGLPGMNAPAAAMAARFDVRAATRVEGLSRESGRWRLRGAGLDEGAFDGLVLALPAEQVAPLVAAHDPGMAARAAATPSEPCWTLMAAFAARLPIEADVLKKLGSIGWAARNAAKPGRAGPEAWVIQAGPGWSSEHLEEDPEAVTARLLDVFAREAGVALPPPVSAGAHRWRYARSGSAEAGFLWNGALKLGTCGDWLIGPRVECAWRSGTALASAIVADAQPPLRPGSTRAPPAPGPPGLPPGAAAA